MITEPLTGFLMGLLIGYLLISTLLRIRAVAVSIAAAVVLLILYRFYEGGGNALVQELDRFRTLLAGSQDLVDGALVGKLLSSATHSIMRRR